MLIAIAVIAATLGGLGWAIRLSNDFDRFARQSWFVLITIGALSTALGGLRAGGVINANLAGSLYSALNGVGAIWCLVLFMYCLYANRLPRVTLLGSGLLIFAVSAILAAPFATTPDLPINLLYAVCMAAAAIALAASNMTIVDFARPARKALAAIAVGSLIYLAAMPSAAALPYGASLIGIPLRLNGLSVHANSLGALMTTALLLSLYRPARLRGDALIIGATAATLLLSQSKTSWAAALLGVAVIALFRVGNIRVPTLRVAAVVFCTGAAVGAMYFAAQSAADVEVDTTLTGRTAIWQITLDAYASNPIAGYGPSLWDEEFAMNAGYPWATQAHSTALQTIGQSGLIGGVALAVYALVLVMGAVHGRRVTQGVALALLAALLLRAQTETVVRLTAFDLINLAPHVLLWLMVYRSVPQRRAHPGLRMSPA